MLIGATIQLIITGIQLGGEAITSTSGMQLGDAVDPTSSSSMPSIARMVGLLVTAVMCDSGGHRICAERATGQLYGAARRATCIFRIR